MSDMSVPRQAPVLLSFRAANARSFKDEIELSLLATGVAERHYVRRVGWREVGAPVSVLPVAAIFGANGSGKSNVLKAMDDMRWQVLHSFRHGDPAGGVTRQPFCSTRRAEPHRPDSRSTSCSMVYATSTDSPSTTSV